MSSSTLAIDVGGTRVGVAIASDIARLPSPLTTLVNTDSVFLSIKELVDEHKVAKIVVGLPLNRDGEPTEQTTFTERFTDMLRQIVDVPVAYQDETLSSKRAEAELKRRKKPYTKGDIDALAAVFILEDYYAEGN